MRATKCLSTHGQDLSQPAHHYEISSRILPLRRAKIVMQMHWKRCVTVVYLFTDWFQVNRFRRGFSRLRTSHGCCSRPHTWLDNLWTIGHTLAQQMHNEIGLRSCNTTSYCSAEIPGMSKRTKVSFTSIFRSYLHAMFLRFVEKLETGRISIRATDLSAFLYAQNSVDANNIIWGIPADSCKCPLTFWNLKCSCYYLGLFCNILW